MHRVRIEIRGRVQGVGFRWYALHHGRALGLTGWVRNREDGSVEVEAEGSKESLTRLVELLRQGPTGARVSALDDRWSTGESRSSGFEIQG